MSRSRRILSVVVLTMVISMAFSVPAYAYEGRGGDQVMVAAGEVIDDDLFVGAGEFVMDGTVNGDVVAAGNTITVNGTVTGNLVAAANTVVVNGTVDGDVWAAGAVLYLGDKAKVGGDVIGAGYSLELRPGSTVGRDALMAGYQILLGAGVERNVEAGAAAFEIAGTVGGNVKAEVGEAGGAQSGPPPGMFMGQSTVPLPVVRQGITIDPSARIAGNLEYTQNTDLTFPAGVVAGSVSRIVPPPSTSEPKAVETPAQKTGTWALNYLRAVITILVLGFLLLWLLPGFAKGLAGKLENRPWPSLGWGVVAYAGFFFTCLLVIFVMILGAVVFGLLTLGGLSGTTVWLGILGLFALILGFVLVTSYVAKIVFGMAAGRWILRSLHSPLAEHRFWPMIIGVLITLAVIAVLSFPLIPGFLGGLLNFAVILFGLGALWLWIRDGLRGRSAAAA
jgi:cytoskeletal protein CcmA (bactofilin family)